MMVSRLILGLPLVAAEFQCPNNGKLDTLTGKAGAIRCSFPLNKVFTLPANSGTHGGMGSGGIQVKIRGDQLCSNCTVLQGMIVMTDATGKAVASQNGVYMHHVLTNNRALESTGFLSGALGASGGFVGAGNDNGGTPFRYYDPKSETLSGYRVAPDTNFSTQVVLVNQNTTEQRVTLSYDLEFMEGWVGKPVLSTLVSAGFMIRTNKAGPATTTSNQMTFKEAGTLVYAKGHLHDGGTSMYMEISNAAGPYYKCTSKAKYGPAPFGDGETITNMNDCPPVKVKKGDKVMLKSEYDLKAHAARKEGGHDAQDNMGMFRMIFVADQ